MLERKKHVELKKHVATIHSTNKLSLLQRKISNALLFNAYDELLEKDEHQVHIGELCRIIGYNSNDHKIIKRALVELLSTVLEWNLVDGEKLDGNEKGIWNASSIIADASIEGAICIYSYSNKMKKLLYHPELYGRLNMAVQAKFQSSYGLALYENCIRYQNIGQTPWFDLLQFRKLMGIEEGKYKIFRDFKTRVLDKAVEEVNKYSPIQINPQLRKESRQVKAIQFRIKKSKKLSVAESASVSIKQLNLSKTLKEIFGLSKKQISEVLATHEESYIQQKIALIESSSSWQAGKIKNLARFLLSALKDDYQATRSSVDRLDKKAHRSKQGDLAFKEQQRWLEAIEKDYSAYRTRIIDQAIESLAVAEKKKFMDKFLQYSAKSIKTVLKLQYSKYTKETVLQSPQIRALMRQFAAEQLEGLQVMSIQEFSERK
jgi:plasmid replication initiation protein